MRILKKCLKFIGIVVCVILLAVAIIAADFFISFNDKNPHASLILDNEMENTIESVSRIDENGTLYYVECSENYYKKLITGPLSILSKITGGGCSCFLTSNEDGDIITGRNYDVPHMDNDGNITGLNVIVHCHPTDKYESYAVADAAWLSMIGMNYVAGSLDDQKTNTTPLVLLPYLCMDGMNEKGLTVSILALDLKDGETAVQQTDLGKDSMIISVLLRQLLDNCATVDEAVAYTQQCNMVNTFGYDFHLFISDASGASSVFEWRYNELYVVESDAVTNFYVAFDDAEDCYYNGSLKESYPGPAQTDRTYHYGYGHGYARFNTIVSKLNDCRDSKSNSNCQTKMKNSEAVSLLKDVAQGYDGMLTSFTQYSVLYNQNKLSLELYLMQDYSKPYYFSFSNN